MSNEIAKVILKGLVAAVGGAMSIFTAKAATENFRGAKQDFNQYRNQKIQTKK